MKAVLKNVLLLLLTATLTTAERDPDPMVVESIDLMNDTDTVAYDDDVPYPDIMACVCGVLMMLIVLYLHIRIPQIRAMFKCSLPSFLVGMISLYISLVILYSTDNFITCDILGYMLGFSIMASMFWFSVMCYESYTALNSSKRSVIMYCLCGWGILGAFLILCPILSNTIGDEAFQPPFIMWICSYGNDTAMLLYFVLPLSLMMLANLYLLRKTKHRINQIAKQSKDTIRTDTKLDHERFFLTVLIFITLTLSFTLNVLSWAFQYNHVLYLVSSISFYVVGVVIFLSFLYLAKTLKSRTRGEKTLKESITFGRNHIRRKSY